MKTTLILFLLALSAGLADASNWVRFRGPNGTGKAEGRPIPTKWSAAENLKWSVPLPGKGSSSPIVFGDRVYVTCYTGYGLDRREPGKKEALLKHLIAFDRNSGKEVWRATVKPSPAEDPFRGFIQEHGYASSTPTTDGERIYAFFGKSGLFAFDTEGNEVWRRSLGTMSDPAKWGGGSSPIVYGNMIVVNAGVVGNRFVAVHKKSGDIVWSIDDPSFTNCWSTPTVVSRNGGDEIVFHVPKRVIAVDPQTGKKNWDAESPLDDATCASIVESNGNVFLMGSRAGRGIGIRCGGSGDVSKTHTIWNKGIKSGICTPVVVDKNMYWTAHGIFFAADMDTGEYVYRERLPRLGRATGGFANADYSSPVVLGDQILLFTRYGESYVIQAGQEFKVVGHNPGFEGDDSSFNGSPAIDDGEIFIRSDTKLYCIATKAVVSEVLRN